MKQIKKHSIGYNTVSNVNGIISARGVKSKPNDIQIFGYTHEIGEGEKSPDNPYELVSLDSGAMTAEGVDYEHSIILSNNHNLVDLSINKMETSANSTSIKYNVNKYNNNLEFTSTGGSSANGIGFYFPILGKIGEQAILSIDSIENLVNLRLYKDLSKEETRIDFDNDDDNNILYKFTITENTKYLRFWITGSTTCTLKNIKLYYISKVFNSIQVPVPIALNSVDGVSDRIIKKDNEYYIEQNIQYIIANEEANISVREHSNSYVKFNINIENGRVISKNKIKCDKLIVQTPFFTQFTSEYVRSSTLEYPNIIVAYMLINRFTTNDTVTKDEILAYLKDNNIEILYQVENPYYLKLSDYAQDLLNSFTLQNQNEIFVDGYPNLKISGYIQE